LLLSRLTPHSSFGNLITGVLVAGVGIGIFVPPNNSTLMGAAPRSQHGMASGVLATSRTVGMGIGIALAGVIHTSGAGFLLSAVIAFVTAIICAGGSQRIPANTVIIIFPACVVVSAQVSHCT